MRLTYEKFCHIVNEEILYLSGEHKVSGVEWGEPISGVPNTLPSVVSLTLTMPELEYDKSIGLSSSDEPEDPEYDKDEEVDVSYEFTPSTFEGELVDLNTIMIHSDEGEVLMFSVFHEVPVDLKAAYRIA